MIQIQKITIESDKYPKQLRKIKNPPKQLYFKGNIDLLKKNIFSIIGSRHGTENGLKQAKQFASELSMQGLVIASGMAIGIDSAAHRGTIETKGETIAVLGNGLDNIYPKENTDLFKDILKNNGLVISEYPPEVEASSKLFLQRNRIVSGISIGVLVVEASYRSGTSVTARYAYSQGKKVFVLPHEIDKKYGVGTNKLIKEGAFLVTSTEDIMNHFDFLTYKKIEPLNLSEKFENKEHEKVYMVIKRGTKDIDEISKKINKNISEVINILFSLEIQGYIKKVAGGYICSR